MIRRWLVASRMLVVLPVACAASAALPAWGWQEEGVRSSPARAGQDHDHERGEDGESGRGGSSVEWESPYLRFEPEVVDFGHLMRGDKSTRTVKITNVSEEPVTIARAVPTCVCTVPTLPKDTLEPGESIEVPLEFTAKREGTSNVSVRFILANDSNVFLRTTATVSPVISVEPEEFDLEGEEDVEIVLRSNDGTPLKVLAVVPDVAGALPEDAGEERRVVILRERLEALPNPPRYVRIHTDHPRDTSVVIRARVAEPSDLFHRLVRWAAGAGEISEIEALVEEGVDINETDQRGRTALMAAAHAGETQRVEELLALGATVDAARSDGRTALMDAALSGNPETILVLLQAGADVNAVSRHGQTALLWAARAGGADRVKVLLENGADPTIMGPFEETALMYAVRSGDPETVRLMVEAGVPIEATNRRGETAIDQARQRLKVARPEKLREGYRAIVDYLVAIRDFR